MVWTLVFSFDGSRWRQVRIPFSPDVKPSPSNFAEWRMVRWRHSGRAIHQIAPLSPSILTANPSSSRNFRASLRRADRCLPIRRTAFGFEKARTLCGSIRMAGDEWIRDIAADMQGRIWILSASMELRVSFFDLHAGAWRTFPTVEAAFGSIRNNPRIQCGPTTLCVLRRWLEPKLL